MKTLPKYFIIKRDTNNPLWKDYIEWLNKTYKRSWSGAAWNFYGFDGGPSCGGTNALNDIEFFKNNPTLLTLEEWSEMVNGFKLPEMWCINKNLNSKLIGEWFNENSDVARKYRSTVDYVVDLKTWPYLHYPAHDKTSCTYMRPLTEHGYVEINLEEFKKHVLKEEVIDKFVLPEMWCVEVTRENVTILEGWRDRGKDSLSTGGFNGGYLHSNKYWKNCIMVGYKEISFEQFKKYVLNQTEMEKVFVKVIDFGKSYDTHTDARKYGCTNYHYWKKLPTAKNGDILEIIKEIVVNETVPSYILKDESGIEYIIGIKGVSLIKDNVMKKEIIGYKLIKPELHKAVQSLTGYSFDFINLKDGVGKDYQPVSVGSYCYTQLKKVEVLDLWFEPVYEEDNYKVGDWITIEDSSKLEVGCCGCPKGTYKIIPEKSIYGLLDSKPGFNIQTNEGTWRISSKGVRKATLEEIKATTEIELNLSTITLKYKEGDNILSCRHGVVSFKDVEDLFDLMNSIIGYEVMGYGLDIETFSVGCIKLTYADLKKVWDFVQEKR